MKKSKLSEAIIAFVLRQADEGTPVAIARGTDVDQPRNLATQVTAE